MPVPLLLKVIVPVAVGEPATVAVNVTDAFTFVGLPEDDSVTAGVAFVPVPLNEILCVA